MGGLLLVAGVASCPPGCTCTELTTCNKPYPLSTENRPALASTLTKCFSKAGRIASEKCVRFPEGTYPQKMVIDDARLLCFWFGKRCGGIGCTNAVNSLGSGSDCCLHEPN